VKWTDRTFFVLEHQGTIVSPFKRLEIFWLYAVGSNHTKQPGDRLLSPLGVQLEKIINNPLVNRDGLSHGLRFP
jgi:hypothetical protein